MNQPSAKLNYIFNLFVNVLSVVFPLLTFPYISRTLSPSGYGAVEFSMAIASYFSMFAMLGVNVYGVRECAKVRDSSVELAKTSKELFTLTFFTSCIACALLILSALFIPSLSGYTDLLLINSLTVVLNSIGVNWFFSAIENYKYIAIRSVMVKIVSLVLMYTFVKTPDDTWKYALILVIANGGANLLNYRYMRGLLNWNRAELEWRKHLKPLLTFFLISIGASVCIYLDTVMLGFLSSDAEVGYFSLAVRIRSILVTVTTSLSVVLLPRASFLLGKGESDEFWKLTGKNIRVVIALTVPIIVYTLAFGDLVIAFLGGDEYLGSVLPLKILIFTTLFIGCSSVTGTQVLVPLGHERVVAISYFICAVADFVLNLMLVPILNSGGAALSTAASELLNLLIQLFVIGKALAKTNFKQRALTPLVASLLGLMPSMIIGQVTSLGKVAELFITGIVFVVGYAAAFFALNRKDDFLSLGALVRGRSSNDG